MNQSEIIFYKIKDDATTINIGTESVTMGNFQ